MITGKNSAVKGGVLFVWSVSVIGTLVDVISTPLTGMDSFSVAVCALSGVAIYKTYKELKTE